MSNWKNSEYSAISVRTAASSKTKGGESAAYVKIKAGDYRAWFTLAPSLGMWILWRKNHCFIFTPEAGRTP